MSQEPINIEFYEKTRAFVVSAVELLISFVQKGEQIPSLMVEENKIEADGSWSTTYKPQPLYYVLIDRHRKEIEDLPELDGCIEAMHSDTIMSKHVDHLVGTWSGRIRRTAWDYLRYLLEKQLSQLPEKLEFNPETFDRMYYELERFFYSGSVKFQAFSPLHNFNSDVDEIDLGDGLQIRRITRSELEELLNHAKWLQMPYLDVPHLKYAMELTYQTKKMFGELPRGKVPSPDVDVNARFNNLVTALRLFKSGIVGFNIIKRSPMIDVPAIFGGTTSGLVYKRFWGQPYTLTGTEVDEFRNFWDRFNKIDPRQPAPLSVAIRRFNYAYERNRLEDKLVDYMIAFEALFFKQGETGEFRHRLAIRVSRFLKQSYEDREEITREMKEFYGKRSAVVHGEKVDLSGEFVNKVEDHLRESIRLFLKRLQTLSHNEIISHLDLD